MRAARTSVAEDKVKDVEVLGAEDVAMAAAAVAVAVHYGRRRRAEFAQETRRQPPAAAQPYSLGLQHSRPIKCSDITTSHPCIHSPAAAEEAVTGQQSEMCRFNKPEHEDVDALGHVAPADDAPLHEAQREGLECARQAVDGQLHAP